MVGNSKVFSVLLALISRLQPPYYFENAIYADLYKTFNKFRPFNLGIRKAC